MTAYSKGTTFERRVREKLTGVGWTVIRSAGSKTKVDLVALAPDWCMLVQCKHDGDLPKTEWDELFRLASLVGGFSAVLAKTVDRGRLIFFELSGLKVPYARWDNQPLTQIHPLEWPALLDKDEV